MNETYQNAGSAQIDVPKFKVIFNDISESMAEIRSATSSIRSGLHRLHDTNVPEPTKELKNKPDDLDLVSILTSHAESLMQLRSDLIELSRKVNQLI